MGRRQLERRGGGAEPEGPRGGPAGLVRGYRRSVAADFNGSTAIQDVAVIPPIGAPAPRDVPNPDGSHDTISFGSGARVPNALTFDKADRKSVV